MRILSGDEIIHANTKLLDFWQWAYSDILSNRNRSIFAEFLVGSALGVLEKPRLEWDYTDLRYKNHTIEVKSSAYLQSWDQQGKLSKITFDIAPKKGWDAEKNEYLNTIKRYSDLYVFCLLKEQDREKINPLDVKQWTFYVVETNEINTAFGKQKSVVLGRVEWLVEGIPYEELQTTIEQMIQRLQ